MSRTPPPSNNRTWVISGIIGVVVAVAVAVAVAAGGSGDDSSSGGGKGNPVEVAAVSVSGSPLPEFPQKGVADKAIGATIPTLSGKSLFDGSSMTIAPAGKPQLVVFLAHWCPHCQAEVPLIVDLAKADVLDGIDVTGIATGTRPDAPNYPPSAWLEREEWLYPAMADSKTSTAAAAYGLTAYPNMVFIDSAGKVVARSQGEVTRDVLVAALKDLKAGRALSLGAAGSSSSAS